MDTERDREAGLPAPVRKESGNLKKLLDHIVSLVLSIVLGVGGGFLAFSYAVKKKWILVCNIDSHDPYNRPKFNRGSFVVSKTYHDLGLVRKTEKVDGEWVYTVVFLSGVRGYPTFTVEIPEAELMSDDQFLKEKKNGSD